MTEPQEPDESSTFDEAREFLRKTRMGLAALTKALEQSLDSTEVAEWEQPIAGPAPEPESSTDPPPPTEQETDRQERQREQIRENWPDRPSQVRRKPWRSR